MFHGLASGCLTDLQASLSGGVASGEVREAGVTRSSGEEEEEEERTTSASSTGGGGQSASGHGGASKERKESQGKDASLSEGIDRLIRKERVIGTD